MWDFPRGTDSMPGRGTKIQHAAWYGQKNPCKKTKWDLIKLKNVYTAKGTMNKTKRQPVDWKKIFANDAADKRLISKVDKQLLQSNINKTNNLIKKEQ